MWEADVQVSSAIQDFFGASACEAIYCGCLPILPDRLNYPTFIPDPHRELCLYRDPEGLTRRLRWACQNPDRVREISLRDHVARYDWQRLIEQYDSRLESIVG